MSLESVGPSRSNSSQRLPSSSQSRPGSSYQSSAAQSGISSDSVAIRGVDRFQRQSSSGSQSTPSNNSEASAFSSDSKQSSFERPDDGVVSSQYDGRGGQELSSFERSGQDGVSGSLSDGERKVVGVPSSVPSSERSAAFRSLSPTLQACWGTDTRRSVRYLRATREERCCFDKERLNSVGHSTTPLPNGGFAVVQGAAVFLRAKRSPEIAVPVDPLPQFALEEL